MGGSLSRLARAEALENVRFGKHLVHHEGSYEEIWKVNRGEYGRLLVKACAR